ncbi:MAG: hypothetical protein PVSMB4_08200 [Ktedonobacterales bacterium]
MGSPLEGGSMSASSQHGWLASLHGLARVAYRTHHASDDASRWVPTMTDLHHIGVLSDTHIPFRARRVPDAVLRHFTDAKVELILHAGDLSSLDVVRQLEAYAPVEAVCGNVEFEDVGLSLAFKRTLVVGGCVIGIVHNLGERRQYARNARQEFPDARVVVFGHSHIPLIEDTDGLLLLNPGSATDRRSQPHCTIAILTIADAVPSARLITLL